MEWVLVYKKEDQYIELSKNWADAFSAESDPAWKNNEHEWNDGGEIFFPHHLRVNIPDTQRNDKHQKVAVNLALKVEEKDLVQKVISQVQQEETEEIDYILWPQDGYLNGIRYYFSADLDDLSSARANEYTSVGSRKVIVQFDSGDIQSMTLHSLLTDEDYDFCDKLINDLYAVEHGLVSKSAGLNEASLVKLESVEARNNADHPLQWLRDACVNDIQECDEFLLAYDNLKDHARAELKQYPVKQSYRKVRKWTAKAYIENNVLKKEKVSSFVFHESLDTYEHRVIKGYMKRLQRELEQDQKSFSQRIGKCKKNLGGQQKVILKQEDGVKQKKVNEDEVTDPLINDLQAHVAKLGEILQKDSLMRKVSTPDYSLRPTNLFSYNDYYQRVYALISGKNQIDKLDITKINEAKKNISLDKLEVLYERWCLIHILQIFIETYRFTPYINDEKINGMNGLKNWTENLLKKIADIQRYTVETREELGKAIPSIDLVAKLSALPNPVEAKTEQNRTLHVKVRYQPDCRLINKTSLFPDIVLTVYEDGKYEERINYIFDAKYRGYDGSAWGSYNSGMKVRHCLRDRRC